jgi:hypothetical protein
MYFMYVNLNTYVFKDCVCLISCCAQSNVCTFELENSKNQTYMVKQREGGVREHAFQIVGAMDAFFAGAHFLSVQNPRGIGVNGLDSAGGWDGG